MLINTLAAPVLQSLLLDIDLLLYSDWAALDVFLGPARFPRLRSVIFKCSAHGDHPSAGHQFLRRALPLLGASGVLRTEW
jgi:hypothetical protein